MGVMSNKYSNSDRTLNDDTYPPVTTTPSAPNPVTGSLKFACTRMGEVAYAKHQKLISFGLLIGRKLTVGLEDVVNRITVGYSLS